MSLSGDCPRYILHPCHRQARYFAALMLCAPVAAHCESSAQAGADSAVFDTVVVTARRVEEPLQSVPISVQVLPGELIDTTDLTSLYDLQFYAPGLVVTDAGMFGAGIALRGVSDQGGGSLAVAPYFNGVYLGTSNLALSRMFDVDRVEVVKGPQGTLYGRNATGGSINFISRPPEDNFSAGIEAARGSFDTVRVQGHVNLPAERFAVRVAMTASDGNGYIQNSVDDRTFGEQDYWGVRGSVRAQPTDRLAINLTAQHVYDDGATGELWLPRRDNLVDPGDIWLTTVTVPDPYLKNTDDVLAADFSFDLDRAVLRSVTGYARNKTRGMDDCAGIPLLQGCTRGVHPDIYDQWSQEIRIESAANSTTRWLAGLYWLDANASTKYQFRAPLISTRPVNDYSANADNTAYAAFGHATYPLNPQWSVTAGTRVSYEKYRLRSSGHGIKDNETPITEQNSWTDWSWRIGVEFAPDEKRFFYGSVATGYKSGGFTPELLPTGEFDSFDPEDLTAYEVGANLQLPGAGSVLRASAFLYDYDNLQVQTLSFGEGQPTSAIDNAASARIYGLDATAEIDLAERWLLRGGVVWMPERDFRNFQTDGEDLSGNKLSRAPEWSSSVSVGYRLPIPGVGLLTTRVDYNHRSRFYFTKENDPWESQGGFGLMNVVVRLESATERWYLFAIARNVTDADYFNQAFIQSNPGYPANQEIGFGVRF